MPDCLGQSPVIDSIRLSLKKSHGAQRVDLLNAYGYIKLSYNYVEAKKLIDEAYALSKELHYERGTEEALFYYGLIEFNIGNDSLARHYFRKGLSLQKREAHIDGQILSRLGQVCQNNGLLDSANFYYQRAYQLLKDSLDPLGLSYLYLNLAEFNKISANQKDQLNYLLRSWEIRKRLPEKHPQVWAGVNLSSYYIDRGEYAVACDILKQALEALAKDTTDNEEISVIYKYKAIIESHVGNHFTALNLFNKAISFYEHNPFPWDLVNLQIEIGFVQAQAGNYETGLRYYFQALKLAETNHFNQKISQLYFRIGRVYYFLNQYTLAEEFANKALAYSTAHHLELDEANVDNLIGSLNIAQKKYGKARIYFDRALVLRQKNDFKTGVSGVLANIGELDEAAGDFKEAESYYLKALAVADQLDYALGKCYSYQSLGQLYLKLKEYDKAEEYLDKAEIFSKKIHYQDVLSSVYKSKSLLWRARADFKRALSFADRYESLKDSLVNKNLGNRILSLQYDFNIEQKNKEIKILGQQKELQKSELELRKAQIEQQRLVIGIGIFGFIIICVAAYISYNIYQKVKSLNREISEQNEEITAQSEELREANDVLSKLNQEISEQNEEITTQSEELKESNEVLSKLNAEVRERNEEIQAQAEELAESYQTIARVNETLEEKISVRTAELKNAYTELDTFFYRSSHDFRRPLTTFMGLAEVAKVTVKDQAALELFEKVNETARNLDKMLVKLQSMSAAGTQELIYSNVLLEHIFQIELDNFREDLIQKAIRVTLDINLRQPFYSYPALVKFIVQNLLENAIAFSAREEATVLLKAYSSSNEVVIEVADNGQGIISEYLPRVFEMYFRANERSRGNGLGLYIVKKMVDKLNGRIELKSEVGIGTTVRVFLRNHFN